MSSERREGFADEESPLLAPTGQPPQQHQHSDHRDASDASKLHTMATLATIAAIYGGTAVALGAFGAHGLRKRITEPQRLQNWGTAAQVRDFLPPLLRPPFALPIVPRRAQAMPCIVSCHPQSPLSLSQ
jgi:hypothetical protein